MTHLVFFSPPHHRLYLSDDENDASDDSANEDPHIVSMDRSKTRAENERQKNRDRFLELEQGLLDFSWKKFIEKYFMLI